MNRNIKKLFLVFITTVAINTTLSAGIVLDLSTGVMNGTTGTPIAYGSIDDTWVCAFPGSTTFFSPVVCSNLSGAWDVNNCGRWITNKLSLGTTDPHPNPPSGLYTYKTSFNLSSISSVNIKVNFTYVGGDNNLAGFYINGHSYSLSPSSANDFNPLTHDYSFNVNINDVSVGANTVIIYLKNSESYQGLFICGNISATYY